MVKILYIEDNEDNEDNIYMVSRRLHRKGYEVVIARDGAEGLAQVASQVAHLAATLPADGLHAGMRYVILKYN